MQLSPQSNFRTFSSPQKETLCALAVTPHFPLGPRHRLSVSKDLPFLDIWGLFVTGFFHLAGTDS